MTIRHRTQYLLIDTAILTASIIQLARGLRLVIVIVAALTFLLVGNGTVYLAGSKQRAMQKEQKRKYYAGIE